MIIVDLECKFSIENQISRLDKQHLKLRFCRLITFKRLIQRDVNLIKMVRCFRPPLNRFSLRLRSHNLRILGCRPLRLICQTSTFQTLFIKELLMPEAQCVTNSKWIAISSIKLMASRKLWIIHCVIRPKRPIRI